MTDLSKQIEDCRSLAQALEDFGYCLCDVGTDDELCPDCQRILDLRAKADRLEGGQR